MIAALSAGVTQTDEKLVRKRHRKRQNKRFASVPEKALKITPVAHENTHNLPLKAPLKFNFEARQGANK